MLLFCIMIGMACGFGAIFSFIVLASAGLTRTSFAVAVPLLITCIVLFVCASKCEQPVSPSYNWLIIENSGGDSTRHWILKDNNSMYLRDYNSQFQDSNGNTCYLSDGLLHVLIKQDYTEFHEDYKSRYNIPLEQDPLW